MTPNSTTVRSSALLLPLLLCACGHEKAWNRKSEASIDLYEKGLYAQALAPADDSLRLALEHFGEKDVRTVYSLDHLGKIYLRMGRLKDAEPLFERTVRINKEILGADAPKAAYYLANLADLRMRQERYDEAEDLYGDALRLYRKAYGEFNNRSAGVQARMAVLYKNWGLHEPAERLLRRVGAILDRVDDQDEAVAADVESAWCAVLLEGRRTGEAREHCERAFSIREKILPPGHTDLAEAMGGLGLLYVRRGRLEEAERILSRAEGVYKENPGADHHGHLAALMAGAELAAARGRVPEAAELFNKALSRFENSYAAVKAMARVARFHQKAGNLDLAEDLYRNATLKYEDSPKADSSDRETLLAGLVEVSLTRKNYAAAERLLERALPEDEDLYGGKHRALTQALYEMSRSYLSQGRRGRARELVEKLKWVVEADFPLEDSLRGNGLEGLAELYIAVGDKEGARQLRRRARAFRSKMSY